tara:strand:- start:31 stop:1032 length:1002 start_codon:yes stop_codon:yes gene_type:complete
MKKSNSRGFPFHRGRRLRISHNLREIVAETFLRTDDLVMPYFICEDYDKTDLKNKFGFKRFTINELLKEFDEIVKLGIKSVALFPKIEADKKTDDASECFNENNLVSRVLKKVSKEFPDLLVISDVALDPYTSTGHDGIINANGEIDNDITIQILVKMSLNLASSGCKIIAPSDMMDGRIKIIRENLEANKFSNVNILSYSSKFCSNFYSPFRDALGSKTNLGDSKKDSYQIDYRNSREAIKESLEDIEEGADIVMVKPAGYYLDILSEIKKNCLVPVAAYQVSGEYVMIKNASNDKFIDYKSSVLESLSCIKRAGADIIFSYFSKEVAEWLK